MRDLATGPGLGAGRDMCSREWVLCLPNSLFVFEELVTFLKVVEVLWIMFRGCLEYVADSCRQKVDCIPTCCQNKLLSVFWDLLQVKLC